MIAVMISINPQRCELITKKEKTIEVRKTRPKIKTPFKCYIYETKGLYRGIGDCLFQGSGKVIGEFVCDDISKNYVRYDPQKDEYGYWTLLDDSCLTKNQLMEYGKCHTLFGWHISDIVIYDKPKELYEFNKLCTEPYQYCQGCKHGLVQYPSDVETYEDLAGCCFDTVCLNQLQKPPQSWCYVEVKE